MTGQPENVTRRMKRLIDAIHLVAYQAAEPNAALEALGLRHNYWDGYFAGRAAPLGRAPAEVVHAVFYNFADGEVARHIPRVWSRTTPEAALAARERGCATAVRRILGDLADSPGVGRAADLALKAASGAPTEARPLFAGLRSLPVPEEPVARLWHAATLLREYRGDGHNIALAAAAIGGTESHMLRALADGCPPLEDGRISHLPRPRLAAVIDGLRARGIVDAADGFTDAGRELRERIEVVTDELDAPAYEHLQPGELDRLFADLEPIAAVLTAADSR
ncbi:MAG: SCO6745 family protein [Candidatus Dormibacteraceae bacterium]